MTYRGELYAINRQGIKKNDSGPLAKSSFEDTTDQLIKSSIFSEKDNLGGVSSNIMLGQLIQSGTGYSDILLDEDKLKNNLSSIFETEDDYIEIDEDNIDILMDIENEEQDGCSDNDFKFSNE